MLKIELRIDLLEFLVKDSFTTVTERCVSDIVTQCDGLYEINIKIECAADRGSNIVNIKDVL